MMQSNEGLRLPEGFRKSLQRSSVKRPVKRLLRSRGLSTVCEEARCPNIGECFSNNTATFMIMGDRCTRRCRFCSVTTKKPLPLDYDEPKKLLQTIKDLGLDHVVITSVDRDDLKDCGARHFARVAETVKTALNNVTIEVLTPDFKGKPDLIDMILSSGIDVFSHNIETVKRLYRSLRPQSTFEVSKAVLKHAAKNSNGMLIKSGMMVGVGESDEEVFDTLLMLKESGVEVVTIGQYLRPSLKHWPVRRYVALDSYKKYKEHGLKVGLTHVYAGPFVRSSYNAKEVFMKGQA